MSLLQNDGVIRTIAANRAAQSFHEGTLPGRTRCRQHFLDVQAGQAAPYLDAVDATAVADQATRRRLEREGVGQLPADPRRGQSRRNVDVGYAAALVALEDDEDVERAKRDRGDDKTIRRGQAPLGCAVISARKTRREPT